MIDLLHLRIPLKRQILIKKGNESSLVDIQKQSADGSWRADLDLYSKSDGLIVRNQTTYDDGQLVTLFEGHSFESLPSSYTGVACCFRACGHVSFPEPFLEVKFSPAKILQGHNVFGPDVVAPGFLECLAVITRQWPVLASHLDVSLTHVLGIDITYSAYFDSPTMVHQAKKALEHAGSGHTNKRKTAYESSLYWSIGSSYSVKKVYEKGPEVEHQIKKLRKSLASNPSDQSLIDTIKAHESVLPYAQHLLRFEASIKKRTLEKYGIRTRIYDLMKVEKSEPTIYRSLWNLAFKPILESLEGLTMTTLDHAEICKRIDNQFITYSSTGRANYRKARAVRAFYVEVSVRGLDQVKSSMAPRTFYDNYKSLQQIGLSKTAIASLSSPESNIVPLVRVINVDFEKQYPDNYQHPKLKLAAGMEAFL